MVGIDPFGTDTITLGANIRLPVSTINAIFGTNIIGNGASAGFALSFPGLNGGELDLGFFVTGTAGGADHGTGKLGFELGYSECSVSDLAGEGSEFGFNDGIGGLSTKLDKNGVLTGGAIHLGPGYNVSGVGTLTTTFSIRRGVQN